MIVVTALLFGGSLCEDVALDQNRIRGLEIIGRSVGGRNHQAGTLGEGESSTAAEDAVSNVDDVAVQSVSQISIEAEESPNQQEIERRRKVVRDFFNAYWVSIDDKPATFAERLNRAEGYINERLAAYGEAWQLDHATRKQLDLPPPDV